MEAVERELLGEIADDFVQFLMLGNLTSFSDKIDPNLNIQGIERLLRIHFVLTKDSEDSPGVIDFVHRLPDRLRSIRTSTKHQTDIFSGEIRGRIDWNDTIKQRYRRSPGDVSTFVCGQAERDYQIAENLVVKELLGVVYDIVHHDLDPGISSRYEWLDDWWKDDKSLRQVVDEAFLRNVYLKRTGITKSAVSGRMVDVASKSRTPLYREAAFLLQRYRKLMKYEMSAQEAKELLRNTFIKPKKTEVLFELYWAIRIAKQFREAKFHILEPGSNLVAEWDVQGCRYQLYHNSSGGLTFGDKMTGLEEKLLDPDNYLGRTLKVLERLRATVDGYSGSGTGRPDILLKKFDCQGKLASIFIGEVKYTSDRDYAIQGLKELLEYMALVRDGGDYWEGYDDLFSSLKNTRGALLLYGGEGLGISSSDAVQVVTFKGQEPLLI